MHNTFGRLRLCVSPVDYRQENPAGGWRRLRSLHLGDAHRQLKFASCAGDVVERLAMGLRRDRVEIPIDDLRKRRAALIRHLAERQPRVDQQVRPGDRLRAADA